MLYQREQGKVKKETTYQSSNSCGKIVSEMWVNKYIDRSIHEKMRKRPHEFLTLGRAVMINLGNKSRMIYPIKFVLYTNILINQV